MGRRLGLLVVLTAAFAAVGRPVGQASSGAGGLAPQDPGAVDFGDAAQWEPPGKPLPRQSDVQEMMIDILDIEVPVRPGRQARNEGAPTPHGFLGELWAVLTHRQVPWANVLYGAPGFWLDPLGGAKRQGVTRAARVHAYLTSLGTSTGEAFDIQIVNDGTAPVRIGGDGVVVQPIKKGSERALRAELQQVALQNQPVSTVRANAYCLEFKLKPPEQGNMFRVSDAAAQQKYSGAREILRASRRLQASGQLEPDSDPADYFHAIRQWSMWVDEQKFTVTSYRKAFIERTKKNAEALGRKWSKDLEDGLVALVPHRWDEITKILREARRPVPGA